MFWLLKGDTYKERSEEARKYKNAPIIKKESYMIGYFEELYLKEKIANQQASYIHQSYEERRIAITKLVQILVRNLWKEVPMPHLRYEFASTLTLTISLSQLWNLVTMTMSHEYGDYTKSFVPCGLIDQFQEFINIINNCHRHIHPDMGDFSTLLRLRDAVVDHIQEHFRIVRPIKLNETVKFLHHSRKNRYHPYDFEWLAGSTITGPPRLACAQYLCVSRMAHLDLATLRSDIIGMQHSIQMGFIKNVRAPIPKQATDSRLLTDVLNNTEEKMREDYETGYDMLKTEVGDSPELEFMHNNDRFHKLTGLIRIKKRTAIEEMPNSDPKELLYLMRLIAALTYLETDLLVLNRVAALFMDKKLGIYGPIIPSKLLDHMEQMFAMACKKKHPRDPIWREKNNEQRAMMMKFFKDFFTNDEERCEKLMTEPVEATVPEGNDDYAIMFDITAESFPEVASDYSTRMMEHLTLQQMEIRRLLAEFHLIRFGTIHWPSTDVQLTIHNCPKGVISFRSNARDHLEKEIVTSLQEEASKVWKNASNISSVGYEIIEHSRKLMDEQKAVPDFESLREEFTKEFHNVLGDKKIGRLSNFDLAFEFASIIERDIALMGYRKKYTTTAVRAAEMAKKLVPHTVKLYMSFVNEAHKDWDLEYRLEDDSEFESDEEGTSSLPPHLAHGREYFGSEMVDSIIRSGIPQRAEDRARIVEAMRAKKLPSVIIDNFIEQFFEDDGEVTPDILVNTFLANLVSINIPEEFQDFDHNLNLPID